MLHQPVTTFAPALPASVMAAASPDDLKRARAWIVAARKCGLSVYPWKCTDDDIGGVMQFGQDLEGPNDYGAATKRFMRHPDADLDRTIPKGLIYELLCGDYDVDPEAPGRELCAKVRVQVAAEGEERQRLLAERKLLTLCRRASGILVEAERLETELSTLTDAFMEVVKPERPAHPEGLEDCYGRLSSAVMKKMLRKMRAKPAKDRTAATKSVLARGLFAAHAKDVAIWESQLRDLKGSHGLSTAEKASRKATSRCRAVIFDIASIPATSACGLAAKCQVMKVCRDTGWALHDEFETLALSIFDDGARCGQMLPSTSRPRRSEPAQPVHH